MGINEGASLLILCAAFKRTPGGIIGRAQKLGLVHSEYVANGTIYRRTADDSRFSDYTEFRAVRERCDVSSGNAFCRRRMGSHSRRMSTRKRKRLHRGL